MNPISYTVTGTGTGRAVNMDLRQNPFNVGVGCVVNGTATFSVQHTFDDFYTGSFNPATATWFNNSGLTNKTSNTDGNYAFGVSAIRLNVTAATGTASVAMTLMQSSNSP